MNIRDFQERRMVERMIFSTPVLIVVVLLAILALIGVWNMWRTKHALDIELAHTREELAHTKMVKESYEQKFQELATPEGVDFEARARFNLKKPGEEVVLFVDAPPATISRGRIASAWHAIWGWIQSFF